MINLESGRSGRPTRCVYMKELQESLDQYWLDQENLEQVILSDYKSN